jgi:hypothetical protein
MAGFTVICTVKPPLNSVCNDVLSYVYSGYSLCGVDAAGAIERFNCSSLLRLLPAAAASGSLAGSGRAGPEEAVD